jgi:hypothetical protein
MPEISRFYGIIIALYAREHGVPHFHAKYAGQTGVFSIADLRLLDGQLPRRVTAMVLEWASDHRDELMADWNLALSGKRPKPIPPLE